MDLVQTLKENLLNAQRDKDALIVEMNKSISKIGVVEARIETWKEALSLAEKVEPAIVVKKRTRSASSDWHEIFVLLSRSHPAPFGYDLIISSAEKIGLNLKRASVRAKMMKYSDQGYVKRISDGEFQITAKGQVFFKLLKIETAREKADSL